MATLDGKGAGFFRAAAVPGWLRLFGSADPSPQTSQTSPSIAPAQPPWASRTDRNEPSLLQAVFTEQDVESNTENRAEKIRAPETAAPQEKEHPFAPLQELTVAAVVHEVLARNPTLAQMAAIAEAAANRYPQVTSLDDPNFGFAMAPQSIGSNNVDFGYRVEVSQKYPFFGKRHLRGENALAEANAAAEDLVDVRLQLIETATSAFYDYYLVFRAFAVYEESLRLLQEARKSAATRYSTGKASQQEVLQMDVEIGRLRERGLTLERMKKVAVARINTLSHLPPDRPLPQAPRELSLPIALPPIEQFRAQAQAQRRISRPWPLGWPRSAPRWPWPSVSSIPMSSRCWPTTPSWGMVPCATLRFRWVSSLICRCVVPVAMPRLPRPRPGASPSGGAGPADRPGEFPGSGSL